MTCAEEEQRSCMRRKQIHLKNTKFEEMQEDQMSENLAANINCTIIKYKAENAICLKLLLTEHAQNMSEVQENAIVRVNFSLYFSFKSTLNCVPERREFG